MVMSKTCVVEGASCGISDEKVKMPWTGKTV